LSLKALGLSKALLSKQQHSLALALKVCLLYLKGLLFTYKNAFNIARRPLKDTFGTMARVFLIRNNTL
jgi:hypothetical protein